MSSVNWLKLTAQHAGSLGVHLGKNDRVEREHSNRHIDKERSHLNSVIGCDDYKDALDKMNARTKEVDAVQPPQRIRKDRKVACMLEFPCPLAIQQQGRDEEFFNTMYKEMQDFFGKENVHGAFVHRDEQHTYTDKNGNECTSLYHAHVLVSAYTEEKGINAFKFETRTRLTDLNNQIDRACSREFGIGFNTHGLAGHDSVEYLKAKEKLHVANKQNKELQQELYKSNQQINDMQQEIVSAYAEREDLQQDNNLLRQENESLHQENESLHKDNEFLHQENSSLRQEHDMLQQESDKLKAILDSYEPTHMAKERFQNALKAYALTSPLPMVKALAEPISNHNLWGEIPIEQINLIAKAMQFTMDEQRSNEVSHTQQQTQERDDYDYDR